MPNNSSSISVPLKGMNQDVHPANLGEQGYDFAQNAVVEDYTGNGFPLLQNEPSTLPCTNFPINYKVIGFVNIVEQDRRVLFLVNSITGVGQIGEILGKEDCDDVLNDGDDLLKCDSCGDSYIPYTSPLTDRLLEGCCEYTIIANDSCLNFSIDHPIKAVYRLEECGVSIYFTDDFNPPRYIEFDYIDDDPSNNLIIKDKFRIITGTEDPCNTPIYGGLDCNRILIDPSIEYPCINFVDVLQGGELRAGVYQFLFAYTEKDGSRRTPFIPATNPIPIFTRFETFETDYRTDRSIRVDILNITSRSPFDYYTIVVAKTINNVTSFEELGIFPTTQKTVIYSGNEKSLKDLTPTDVFEQKVYYESAKYIAESNNFLFLGGLVETKKLNVQRIANNISLQWQTVAVPEPVYRDPRFTNKYRGYMRDEVYALGIVFIFNTGEESVVAHIPGPSRAYFQSEYGIDVDEIITNDDVIDDPSCQGIPRNRRWEVYNIGQLISTDPDVSLSGDCNTDCYQYGDFSYWESAEVYPNEPEIWGDLCGTPIRHHKFPDSSVTHIHDGLNGSKTYVDGNIVFPIGIKINHTNIQAAIAQAVTDDIITQEDADRIIGYRIVRGNRFGHKSIVAKGLIYDVWNYLKDDIYYYYPNYPYNDLNDDPFLTEDPDTYDEHDEREGPNLPFRKTGRYTFHSPDTHFVSPELGEEIKLETNEYGESEGYFNQAEEQAKQKMLSDTSYLLSLAGGILGMLTATNEIREKDYIVRGGTTEIGTQPIPIISGSSPGAFVTIPGVGPTSLQETVTVPAIGTVYENNTGVPTPPLGVAWEIITKTKQNTAEQYLNPIGGPVLGGLLGIFTAAQAIIYKAGYAITEAQVFIDLIKSLTPRVNYAIQYNSVGKYNNYVTVANSGFKRRGIETYSYLKPEMASISEAVGSLATGVRNIFFNNWNRETSVYLKTDGTKTMFNDPAVEDTSRFNIDCRNSSSCDFSNYDKKRFYRDISSYYASIKRYLSDQYGIITNIDYIDTGHCIFFTDQDIEDCDATIFGGDIFINRFALKRKHSYFLQTRFMQQDETDVQYSVLGNVAYPIYYYNSITGIGEALDGGVLDILIDLVTDPSTIPTLLGRPKSYLDAKTPKFFYQNGRIYLYSYGIPYFLVESDINVDYRYAENIKEKNFFPHIQDLDFWLQEKNVPPSEDNYYFYNNTYSKQNKEHTYSQYPFNFEPGRECRVAHPNRIIYSNGDKWLNYKANDFYDFALSNGALIGVDGIENDKVLVRSENTTQVFNAYITIPTSTQNIQVGTGGMFQSKPQEYAHTTLGYAGSQHGAILHTEYGHVWVDAKRGQVFNLSGNTLDEISKDGMKNWFKENLPFQLLKDFPEIEREDIDNNFKGIGLALAFDKRFNRFILTKLDYKRTDPNVQYNPDTKEFFIIVDSVPQTVQLTDFRYFCNKSWTISYNFYLKAWTSFHSYKPNYFIDGIDYFVSGLNTPQSSGTSSVWLHNVTNKSYQVVYGKLEPFTIQTISKPDISKNNLNSIEFGLDAIRYHNEFDPFYTIDITFNKAHVFTQSQNSGLLNLEYNTKSNLYELIQYPIINTDSTTIRITNSDGIWRFNQFYDLVNSRSSNVPIWINDCANVDKTINPQAVNYQTADLNKKRIRGEFTRIKLTNDRHSLYKMIFKWMINKSVKTYR